MALLTKELILDTAEGHVSDKGFELTTLSDIAKDLGVTHAALYKHYKNKEDLFSTLALRWLARTSMDLLNWVPQGQDRDLHDWLWALARTKQDLYNHEKEMFLLYTKYIESNQPLVKEHLAKLAKKVEELGAVSDGMAIITAFTYFHNPYFAPRWESATLKEDFEAVWRIVQQPLSF